VWTAISMAAVVSARGAALPTVRELRDSLRRDLRGMASLLRSYTFRDLDVEGPSFVLGPGKGQVETVGGRWPEQKALRLDRGWLQGEHVDVPERGFTVTCWFRHRGMGGLAHYQGKPAYSNGGIVAVGTGYYDGWRIVVVPKSGTVQFSIARPKVGAVSAVCRSGVEEGRWHHLAATWDRRYLNVYLDGHLRAETAYDGSYTPGHPECPLRIGEIGYGVGTIRLDVAELAMFGEVLKPELIARLANPASVQAAAIVAGLMRGDRAAKFGPGPAAERERRARAEYGTVLALDASGNAAVVRNYQAIARLRIVASLRRERRLDQARAQCAVLAEDESAPLHYRARAMLAAADTFRDERRYGKARAAYRKMQRFSTGRHENWRVEALHRQADVDGRGDGVRITGGDSVLLAGCVIHNMGNWGVIVGGMGSGNDALPDLAQGGRNHGVIGCDIAHTGDGGVSLMGGDVKTLTPSGHFVENCHIHHFDRWNRAGYQPGINLDGVGCRVSHNLIHDGPHQAVRVRRNDHIFEYNEVHDTPYEAREMGLYYVYGRRVLGERGNIARYNYFHHVPYTTVLAKTFVAGGRCVLHIDHMNGGMTIYGNIFHALECPSTFSSGGRENMVENNIFYRCASGVSLGDRSAVYGAENTPPRFLLDQYLRDVRHDQPPWSVRHPQVATLLENKDRALPEDNVVARNISVEVQLWLCTAPTARARSTIEHNWDGSDPGFVDPDKGDFAIRPDSTVFGAIGFDPIPVERIGLYNDELRATWPVHHEVDTHEHMSFQRPSPDKMPTCLARPRTAPVAIDGKLAPAEWDGLKRDDALVLDRSPHEGPTPAPKSYAWIRRDEACLYIGLLNHVNPDKSQACCFNIAVGKPGTPIDPSWSKAKRAVAKWAAWVGTNGPNWQVWNAGRLMLR